jgi:sugar transferase (PEP-CTERM/EpsH1 system associated)
MKMSAADASAPEPGLHVMHLLYMLGIGGMEVGVVKLANRLPPSFVTSICSSVPADDLKKRLNPDVKLYELNRRRGNDPRFVLALYRLLRRVKPDVLHTHGWGTLCEGIAAARLAAVPYVVHGEHGTMDLRGRNRPVQRWVWGRCDRVLSVSSRLAERMAAETGFALGRIQTIRNGVDLARLSGGNRTNGRRMLGLNEADLVIGTVGRLVPVKNQDLLLRALAQLRQRGLTFRAVIVGDGPLRSTLQQAAASCGIGDCVRLAGHHENIPDALAAMDIFVLSSDSEGLSNTIVEAMAAGLPVVATHVGGADELVSHGVTGLLAPPRDPEALAAALEELASDPARRHLFGAEARRTATTRFSVERMVNDYAQMYRAVSRRNAAVISHAASAEV